MMDADLAARAWGGTIRRLITARENAVYEMDLPHGRAALRLHRPGYQSAAAIGSELWWCRALAERGVAVPAALPTLDGEQMFVSGRGHIASAMQWVEGVPIGQGGVPLAGNLRDQADRYCNLGRLLAGMHAATDDLRLPVGFTRPDWSLPGLVGDAPLWGRFWDHPALSAPDAALLRRCRDVLRERLADHGLRGGDAGLIHADVLRENVLASDHALSLIDFDDSGFGFRLYDLGTALVQNLDEPHLPAIAAALIEGYGETRTVDPDMIPVFTLMRACASVGWAMQRLGPGDPIHRSHFARATRLGARVLAGAGFG